MSESIFRLAINTDLSNIKKSILVYLVTEKLSFLDMFPGLSKHYLENSVLEDHHCTQLIKIISGKYFESRIRTWSKNYTVNLKVKGGNLREKLSRTVIFSNAWSVKTNLFSELNIFRHVFGEKWNVSHIHVICLPKCMCSYLHHKITLTGI